MKSVGKEDGDNITNPQNDKSSSQQQLWSDASTQKNIITFQDQLPSPIINTDHDQAPSQASQELNDLNKKSSPKSQVEDNSLNNFIDELKRNKPNELATDQKNTCENSLDSKEDNKSDLKVMDQNNPIALDSFTNSERDIGEVNKPAMGSEATSLSRLLHKQFTI